MNTIKSAEEILDKYLRYANIPPLYITDITDAFKEYASQFSNEGNLWVSVEFKDHDKIILTNASGDTYTSKSEELIDFFHNQKDAAPQKSNVVGDDYRQKLFNYMKEEHGVTLLDSDFNEIENIINPKKYPYKMFDEPISVGDVEKAAEKIDYEKEYTWFDNFYAYWITELKYDGKVWQPEKTRVALALGKSKEQAEKEADKIISLLKKQPINKVNDIEEGHHFERSIIINPTGQPFCCHTQCNNDAKWEIRFSGKLEDYTHSCDSHLIEMIGEDKEIKLTKI